MKNKLIDLRNHLFVALENLAEAESTEQIEAAAKKADAMSGIAKVLIDSARVEIDYLRNVGLDRESDFIESAKALPGAQQAKP